MPQHTDERLHETDEIEETIRRLTEAVRDFLLLLVRRAGSGSRPH
jgi:hypothetical protein